MCNEKHVRVPPSNNVSSDDAITLPVDADKEFKEMFHYFEEEVVPSLVEDEVDEVAFMWRGKL